jgi:MFS family permease
MSSAIAVPVGPKQAASLSVGGLLVLAFGALDFGLESSIVLPALPVFAQEFGASPITVSWLATGFLLASVVAVPLFGRLGDIFGRQRLLFVALGAFSIGSLICALADAIGVVIAGRIIQGAGAAVGPLAVGIARDAVPREQLTRAIGILVGAAGAGAAIGFLLSGVLVEQVSTEAIFWFLFGLSIALLAAASVLVPTAPPRARVPVDVPGAALIASGLTALLLAISKGNDWGWTSGRILGLFVGAVALLAAFVIVERSIGNPLIDLGFVQRSPFGGAILCAFAVGYAFIVVVIAVPQLAALPALTGYGLGYSTTSIGVLLVPMALTSIASAWVAGRYVDAVGPRALMAAGSAAGIAGYLALVADHATPAAIAAATGVLGIGVGLTVTGILSVVGRAAGLDKTSVAIAVNAVMRTTGSAVGTAAAAAIITGALTGRGVPAESGFTDCFLMGAIVSGCALVASAFLPAARTHDDRATGELPVDRS